MLSKNEQSVLQQILIKMEFNCHIRMRYKPLLQEYSIWCFYSILKDMTEVLLLGGKEVT